MAGLALYLDENVDARVADGLRRRGVLVTTAADARMLGGSDEQHRARAGALRAALFTHDPDLIRLAARATRAGQHHHGIIFVEMTRLGVGEVIRRLHRVAVACDRDALVDRIEFL